MGKTRLSLAVAARLAAAFADGVAFISLASVSDHQLVAPTLVRALGIPEQGEREAAELLQATLREQERLLVLDNYEQVVAAAPLVADLLQACPRLTILVTSRTRLGLSSEQVVTVPPLALPDPAHPPSLARLTDYPAVRLFVERAKAAKGSFRLTEDDVAAVVSICLRLDGLPLAIELAAARARVLAPAALLARLTWRLALLTTGPADAPPRLQTMRAAVAWSHDLLTEEEQLLFRRLAIFAGGFTLEAAEAVAGAGGWGNVLDGVASLVDKSLLQRVEEPDGPRFRMLETIREYGLERLAAAGEEGDLRRRHAEWGVALAESSAAHLLAADQAIWLRRLDHEHDNVRTALAWTIEQDEPGLALRLASALWLFWYIRGHLGEGRRWLERALAIGPAESTASRAKAINNLANLTYELGDVDQATALYEQSLALNRELEDTEGIATASNNLGLMASVRGDYARARELLTAGLTLRQGMGDPLGYPAPMSNLGDVAYAEGDYARARGWHERALAVAREIGNARREAHCCNNLGLVALTEGDVVAAEEWFDEGLRLFRAVDDHNGIASALHNLGRSANRRGDRRQAAAHYSAALALHREIGDRRGLADCLEGLAVSVIAAGQADAGARLLGAAGAVREPLAMPLVGLQGQDHETAMATARRTLGQQLFAEAWAAGAVSSRARAIGDAIAIAEAFAPISRAKESETAPDLGLTHRELDVLRLLVDGVGDREIGKTLGISPRTVQTHLANVMSKLGVNTRTAAAAAAMRQGLL